MTRHDESNLTKTDWSMIRQAIDDGDSPAAPGAAAALETLARRYWPAVYAFIRSTGRDVHEAADLTQSFVCDVIIGRKLLNAADPARGRFRSLLLRSLQNYLRQKHRDESRRGGGGPRRPLAMDPGQLAEADGRISSSPEAAFASQWSATLVRRVLEQVRGACLRDGLEPHWIIFEARVVRPMLFGEQPVPYPGLLNRLALAETSQAANMMVTVKRRFARALYAEVCSTLDDAEQTRAEINDLLHDLEHSP